MDEILHHLRNPGMIRFPCKYQQTMVSTFNHGFQVVQDFVHPQCQGSKRRAPFVSAEVLGQVRLFLRRERCASLARSWGRQGQCQQIRARAFALCSRKWSFGSFTSLAERWRGQRQGRHEWADAHAFCCSEWPGERCTLLVGSWAPRSRTRLGTDFLQLAQQLAIWKWFVGCQGGFHPVSVTQNLGIDRQPSSRMAAPWP